MFNFFKKKEIKEVEKKVESGLFVTSTGTYTFEQINNFKKEMRSFNISGVTVNFHEKKRMSCVLGNIVNFVIRSYAMRIDIQIYDLDYYLNVMKTLEYLQSKNDLSYMFWLVEDRFVINSCKSVGVSCPDMFMKYRNFHDGSNFVPFSLDSRIFEETTPRTIRMRLSDYNVEAIEESITKLPKMKEDYEDNCYNVVSNVIQSTVEQFPEEFFEIAITDGSKCETMFTIEEPKQNEAGSYRVDTVLFLGDYFVLIPAVMYRIDIKKKTRKDIASAIIDTCSPGSVKRKLLDTFINN